MPREINNCFPTNLRQTTKNVPLYLNVVINSLSNWISSEREFQELKCGVGLNSISDSKLKL